MSETWYVYLIDMTTGNRGKVAKVAIGGQVQGFGADMALYPWFLFDPSHADYDRRFAWWQGAIQTRLKPGATVHPYGEHDE